MKNDPQLARKENFYTPEIGDFVEIAGGPKAGINGCIKEIEKKGTTEFWSLGIEISGLPDLVVTPARNVILKIKGAGEPAPETLPFEQRTPEQLATVLEYRSHKTEHTGFSSLAIEKLQIDLDEANNLKLIMTALAFILSSHFPSNPVANAISYELEKRSGITTE